MNLTMIKPFHLVIIATILTFIISNDRDAGELNVLGNFIVAVGGLILTVAAQDEYINSKKEEAANKDDIKRQIKELQDKYAKLERKSIR